MWEGKERKMCQYSLGDTEIAGGTEVQCLGLAACTAESEKQWGSVGGLEEERQIWWAGLEVQLVCWCGGLWSWLRRLREESGSESQQRAERWTVELSEMWWPVGKLENRIWWASWLGTMLGWFLEVRWGFSGDCVKILPDEWKQGLGKKGSHPEWGLTEKYWCPCKSMSSRRGAQCWRAARE